MRYLRQQVLNRRSPSDQRLYVDVTDAVVMNTPTSLLLPKGAESDKPSSPTNGMIRYNTTSNELEVYQGSKWRALQFKESSKIIQETLGNIDGYSYFYGPLDDSYDPTNVSSNNNNFGGQNILVFVENVFQIFNTNYVVTQNPTAGVITTAQANAGTNTLTLTSTATIPTGSIATGSPYLQANTVATVTNGTTVTLSKNISGGNIPNGTAITFTAPTGYYLDFTSDVDYAGLVGKPITVLHGFDK